MRQIRARSPASPTTRRPLGASPQPSLSYVEAASRSPRLDGRGPRAAAVGHLYTRFRELTRSFYDEEDMVAAATTALAGGAGPVAAELGHTVVWLPTELSPGEEAFVQALLAGGDATVILGLTGDSVVDDAQARALAAQLGGGGQQELPLVDTAAAPRTAVETPLGTHVLRAPDPEDEVRVVARRIMERASDGVALHEIAVLFRLDEPYACLVPEIFDSAGIAWNGPSPRRLSDSVLARCCWRACARGGGPRP